MLKYDVAKDFEPIVLLADAPLLLVVIRDIAWRAMTNASSRLSDNDPMLPG